MGRWGGFPVERLGSRAGGCSLRARGSSGLLCFPGDPEGVKMFWKLGLDSLTEIECCLPFPMVRGREMVRNERRGEEGRQKGARKKNPVGALLFLPCLYRCILRDAVIQGDLFLHFIGWLFCNQCFPHQKVVF